MYFNEKRQIIKLKWRTENRFYSSKTADPTDMEFRINVKNSEFFEFFYM